MVGVRTPWAPLCPRTICTSFIQMLKFKNRKVEERKGSRCWLVKRGTNDTIYKKKSLKEGSKLLWLSDIIADWLQVITFATDSWTCSFLLHQTWRYLESKICLHNNLFTLCIYLVSKVEIRFSFKVSPKSKVTFKQISYNGWKINLIDCNIVKLEVFRWSYRVARISDCWALCQVSTVRCVTMVSV